MAERPGFASASGELGEALEEIARMARNAETELAKMLGGDDHIIEVGDEGEWGVKHPLTCRPDVLGCAVHVALMKDEPAVPAGMWRVEISDAGNLSFEPA